MKTWFERPACLNRVACKDCRTSREFRETIFAKRQVSEVDFACPHGFTADRLPTRLGLGDIVEKLAKPIAKLLKLDCLEPSGKLKPCSPCARRRDAMNRIGK